MTARVQELTDERTHATAASRRGVTHRWFGPASISAAPLPDRLFEARGIDEPQRAAFMRASLVDVERPWERPDLMRAADAILEALSAKRRIAIYGDYDVDGITATAILWRALNAISPDVAVQTYVPHRMEEGYGVNAEALGTLAQQGIDFVITVDCGVTAVEEADQARGLGIEMVITDHHRPRDDGALPRVRAIVHPRLSGCEHRFRDQCGALIAWKLAWAIFDRHAGSPEGHRLPNGLRAILSSLVPLAAIGTIADVMPLVGENRSIVRTGIGLIRDSGIEGLDAILRVGDVAKDGVDSETIAFRLAPRLNACGRLGSAEAAVRLLTTARGDECIAIARELDELNVERRRTERLVFDDAVRLVRERGLDGDDRRAIVLAHPGWHAGIVGIVCSRLVDRFARPTILFQQFDDHCKGSGRSIRGFSLLDAILTCGEPPLKAGGHDHAAGITVSRERVDAFAEAFIAHASRLLTPEDLIASIALDARARIDELTLDVLRQCEHFGPFGRGNPRPTILLEDVVVTAPPREMGKDGKHLLLSLRHASGGKFLKAKWWSGRVHAEHVRQGARVDVVVEPKIDRYLGDETVEAEVKDVCPR